MSSEFIEIDRTPPNWPKEALAALEEALNRKDLDVKHARLTTEEGGQFVVTINGKKVFPPAKSSPK